MHQQLQGYEAKDKLYVGVREYHWPRKYASRGFTAILASRPMQWIFWGDEQKTDLNYLNVNFQRIFKHPLPEINHNDTHVQVWSILASTPLSRELPVSGQWNTLLSHRGGFGCEMGQWRAMAFVWGRANVQWTACWSHVTQKVEHRECYVLRNSYTAHCYLSKLHKVADQS
jgi:hypothetical protein